MYKAMRDRDKQRRERVMQLAAAHAWYAPEDLYHAAWIMNHGDTSDDARKGHALALRSLARLPPGALVGNREL